MANNPVEDVQEKFRQAIAFQQRGQLAEAQAAGEALLKLLPGHADILHFLGIVAIQKADFPRAEELIGEAIRANPNSAAFHGNHGYVLLQLGQLERAVRCYDRAIALNPNNASAYCNRGIAFQRLKQTAAALLDYGKAIAIKVDYAEAYCNRGSALHELGKLPEAIADFDMAISLRPNFPAAYCNRGVVLFELDQLRAAVDSHDRAIALAPHYADAYYNRGNALQALNQFDRAIADYEQALALKPGHAEACNNRGIALQKLGWHDRAVAAHDQAIALNPEYAEAYCNRGIALQQLKRFADARADYEKAIALQPRYAEAYCNRGSYFLEQSDPVAALADYDRAIELKPDYAEAYCNRGISLHGQGRYDQAISSIRNALACKPLYAEAHFNLGNALKELKEIDAAIENYDKSIEIRPDYADAHWNKSLALLLKGDLRRGWELYEWRWRLASFPSPKRNFSQPLWLGKESLAGKTILLYGEQGLGDTIQFCRYAPLVAQMGARVILEVPRSLVPICQALGGISAVIEAGKELPAFYYQCPILSLPLAFNTDISSIPSTCAYMTADEGKVEQFAKLLGASQRPRVGLVWSGSAQHQKDRSRSIALEQLLAYLPPNCDYVSLQQELRDTDKPSLAACADIQFIGEHLHDFGDTAAACALVDVVVSVDTSVAHLAAAMGKETWVLLPYVPDWRWLLDRSDSPWYPSIRLFRQQASGDWPGVLQALRAELERL